MNKETISKKLRQNEDEYQRFIEEGSEGSTLKIEDLSLKMVEYKRCNSNMSAVFTVNNEMYFQVHGHYDSWSGTSWHNIFSLKSVVPQQKTITVYV